MHMSFDHILQLNLFYKGEQTCIHNYPLKQKITLWIYAYLQYELFNFKHKGQPPSCCINFLYSLVTIWFTVGCLVVLISTSLRYIFSSFFFFYISACAEASKLCMYFFIPLHHHLLPIYVWPTIFVLTTFTTWFKQRNWKKNLGLKLYGSTHDFKPTMKHKDLENETRSKAKAFPIRIGCCYVLIFCSFGRVSFPQVNIKLHSSSGNLPPNFS